MEKGSSSSSSAAGPDSLHGLKFGKKIYFEGSGAGLPVKAGGGPPPPPLSPAKKGRTGALQGSQPPRCQVEGCNLDLSDAKAYYSRHKVCGMHSKSSKVIVAGIEQRFCQQCSRFHQLPEFDQGKRSCRRRLAGHNERRRKPPPGSLLSPRYGSLSPSVFGWTIIVLVHSSSALLSSKYFCKNNTTENFTLALSFASELSFRLFCLMYVMLDNPSKTGGFLMDFSAYSTLPGKDPWQNASSERGLENQATFTGKYQLPWQSNSQNHPLPNLLQGSTNRPGFSGPGVLSNDCFSGASDSSSALSLLSNQPWDSRTRSLDLGFNNFLGTNGSGAATLVQPSSVNPDAAMGPFTCSSWGFKGNQAGNVLHEMPPDLGLGQISHPSNSQYAGELGLAQPNEAQFHELDHSRGVYGPPVQHMHWSL